MCDVQVFDVCFDDEIAVFELCDVVLEVSDAYERRVIWRKERGGFCFCRRVEPGAGDVKTGTFETKEPSEAELERREKWAREDA